VKKRKKTGKKKTKQETLCTLRCGQPCDRVARAHSVEIVKAVWCKWYNVFMLLAYVSAFIKAVYLKWLSVEPRGSFKLRQGFW